ncbi:MAG: hypothetical protein ACYDCQ_04135 [Dehalococcoidia bacterium]
MSDATLYTVWAICLGVAAVVVLLVAALLLAILKAARDIRGNAVRCLVAVQQVAANTDPIWALADTNRVATGILETVQSIEATTTTAADVLEGTEALAG